MSRTDLHAVSGSQSADFSSTVAAPYPARYARDPGHRIEAGKAATIPPAGQAGCLAETPERSRSWPLSRRCVLCVTWILHNTFGRRL